MFDEILVESLNDTYQVAHWMILSIKDLNSLNLLGIIIITNTKNAAQEEAWAKIQYAARLKTMMLVTSIIDPQWTNLKENSYGVTHTHTCKEIVLTKMEHSKFYLRLSPNNLAQNKLKPLSIKFRLLLLTFKRTLHQWSSLFFQLSIVNLQKALIDLASRTYQTNNKGTHISKRSSLAGRKKMKGTILAHNRWILWERRNIDIIGKVVPKIP